MHFSSNSDNDFGYDKPGYGQVIKELCRFGANYNAQWCNFEFIGSNGIQYPKHFSTGTSNSLHKLSSVEGVRVKADPKTDNAMTMSSGATGVKQTTSGGMLGKRSSSENSSSSFVVCFIVASFFMVAAYLLVTYIRRRTASNYIKFQETELLSQTSTASTADEGTFVVHAQE